MNIDGRCHCGRIAYQAVIDPDRLAICHCTDCQTFSGSPYRATIPVPAANFELQRGQPKIYIKTAASGARRAQAFCPECGTPIYAAAPENPPVYSLRLGAIVQRAALKPGRQIWCESALPWAMDLHGLQQVSRQ